MPYKYVGRTTDFCGKTLWEIVGNLKDYGVGRYVYRNMFQRYPEPSYMKILKVEPCNIEPNSARKVIVWVEKVFRGKLYPEPMKIYGATYKTDYRLVPKDQEKEFCKPPDGFIEKSKILQPTLEMPPFLKQLIKADLIAKKEYVSDDDLKLRTMALNTIENKYRVAEDDEEPNVYLNYDINPEEAPNLYKDI